MKNVLLIWNIVLTVAAGFLLYGHFTKGKTASASPKTAGEKKGGEAGPANFRIAYFDMDSLENNYEKVKDVKADINAREQRFSNDVQGLEDQYRKKYEGYAKQGQSMTQEDMQRAQADMAQTEKNLKAQRAQMEQSYQSYVTNKNIELKKAIQDYIVEFNKDGRYSYIVSAEPGLFYFKDSAYDVTAEVVKGLNEAYKATKEKK